MSLVNSSGIPRATTLRLWPTTFRPRVKSWFIVWGERAPIGRLPSRRVSCKQSASTQRAQISSRAHTFKCSSTTCKSRWWWRSTRPDPSGSHRSTCTQAATTSSSAPMTRRFTGLTWIWAASPIRIWSITTKPSETSNTVLRTHCFLAARMMARSIFSMARFMMIFCRMLWSSQ